jgi:hypothetical protein
VVLEAPLRRADPDPQPAELLGPQLTDDRAEAVVATGPAALAEPELAERQREVVGDHEELGERGVLPGENLADGQAESFIQVSGFTSVRSMPRNRPIATDEASRVRPLPSQPARSASRSRTIQPMLWRVFAYWSPGFPRPTTIFNGASGQRPRRSARTANGPDPVREGLAPMVAAMPSYTD